MEPVAIQLTFLEDAPAYLRGEQMDLLEPIVIPLAKGRGYTKVDGWRTDLLGIKPHRDSYGYALFTKYTDGYRRIMKLHRDIMEHKLKRKLRSDEFVDHIDGDKLNNCESNLRIVTPLENAQNRRTQRNNQSGVTGVRRLPNGRYRAQITVNGHAIDLGTHVTEAEARAARQAAELNYFGDKTTTKSRRRHSG